MLLDFRERRIYGEEGELIKKRKMKISEIRRILRMQGKKRERKEGRNMEKGERKARRKGRNKERMEGRR